MARTQGFPFAKIAGIGIIVGGIIFIRVAFAADMQRSWGGVTEMIAGFKETFTGIFLPEAAPTETGSDSGSTPAATKTGSCSAGQIAYACDYSDVVQCVPSTSDQKPMLDLGCVQIDKPAQGGQAGDHIVLMPTGIFGTSFSRSVPA